MKLTSRFALAMALGMAATSASAESVLRYSNWLPATHPFYVDVIQPWISEVSAATDGRVTIEVLPKMVGTPASTFEVIRDGLADASAIVDGYSPGRFKVNSIVELPFLGNDARSISIAYWRIYKKYLEPFGEYENVIPVAKASVGPMVLATGSGPIDTIESFNGLTIRVPNPTASKMVAALGGAPVNKPNSETFELMSTGVVDGMISSTETIHSFKIASEMKNVLKVDGGLGGAGLSVIVNDDALADLSAEDLEAFWEVSGEVFSTKLAATYQGLNEMGLQDVIDAGNTVTVASDNLVTDLKAALAFADEEWVEAAKAAGLENAEAVLAEFRTEIAKEDARFAGQ